MFARKTTVRRNNQKLERFNFDNHPIKQFGNVTGTKHEMKSHKIYEQSKPNDEGIITLKKKSKPLESVVVLQQKEYSIHSSNVLKMIPSSVFIEEGDTLRKKAYIHFSMHETSGLVVLQVAYKVYVWKRFTETVLVFPSLPTDMVIGEMFESNFVSVILVGRNGNVRLFNNAQWKNKMDYVERDNMVSMELMLSGAKVEHVAALDAKENVKYVGVVLGNGSVIVLRFMVGFENDGKLLARKLEQNVSGLSKWTYGWFMKKEAEVDYDNIGHVLAIKVVKQHSELRLCVLTSTQMYCWKFDVNSCEAKLCWNSRVLEEIEMKLDENMYMNKMYEIRTIDFINVHGDEWTIVAAVVVETEDDRNDANAYFYVISGKMDRITSNKMVLELPIQHYRKKDHFSMPPQFEMKCIVNAAQHMAIVWPNLEQLQMVVLHGKDGAFFTVDLSEICDQNQFLLVGTVVGDKEIYLYTTHKKDSLFAIRPNSWMTTKEPMVPVQQRARASSQIDVAVESVESCIKALFEQFNNPENDKSYHFKRTDTNMEKMLTEAIVTFDQRIVDAASNTGGHWLNNEGENVIDSTDDECVFAVMPQLVRSQLEKKLSQHKLFISFLQQHSDHLWDIVGIKSQFQLLSNGDKILSALALCRLQGQCVNSLMPKLDAQPMVHQSYRSRIKGEAILEAIQNCVASRGFRKEQLYSSGLSICDVFYGDVTRIDEIVLHIHAVCEQTMTSAKNTALKIETLVECNVALHSLLEAAQQSLSTNNLLCRQSTALWTSYSNVKKHVLSQITLTASQLGYANGMSFRDTFGDKVLNPAQANELLHQMHTLGVLILKTYPEEVEALDYEFNEAKNIVFNPLIAMCTFSENANEYQHNLLKLCEEFKYFIGLIQLSFQLDDVQDSNLERSAGEKKLDEYCTKFASLNFANTLFQWHAGDIANPWSKHVQRPNLGPLFDQVEESQCRKLSSYISHHERLEKYKWLNMLNLNEYNLAANHLLHCANLETESNDSKSYLLGMGKLSALAASSDASSQKLGSILNIEFELVEIQESLCTLFAEHDESILKPESISQLIHRCMAVIEQKTVNVSFEDQVSLLLSVLRLLESLHDLQQKIISSGDAKLEYYHSLSSMQTSFTDLRRDIYTRIIMLNISLWLEWYEKSLHTTDDILIDMMQQTYLFHLLKLYSQGCQKQEFQGTGMYCSIEFSSFSGVVKFNENIFDDMMDICQDAEMKVRLHKIRSIVLKTSQVAILPL